MTSTRQLRKLGVQKRHGAENFHRNFVGQSNEDTHKTQSPCNVWLNFQIKLNIRINDRLLKQTGLRKTTTSCIRNVPVLILSLVHLAIKSPVRHIYFISRLSGKAWGQ